MKVGEFKQMMAYITRPGFSNGSKIAEPPKSMQVDTTTEGIPLDKPMIPEPKPYTLEQFQERADLFIKGALGGFPKDEMINKLQIELDKVQESGTMSKEEAINFINERTQQLREFIKENPGETLPGLDRENFKDGTPSKFAAPKSAETRGKNTSDKLQNFVKNYKETKGTIPTIMEIAKGTKASTTSVRKYLKEGEDFKITSFIESGKKAGAASAAKKNTGVSKVDEKAFKELKDITKNIKGISVQTTGTKSKSAGLRIGKQYQEIMDQFLGGQPTKYFPADREGIQKLKNLATEIANSEVYAKNVTPFLTSEEKLAVKRAKAASYKEKDPFNVYRKLQEYKTEKFPGVSREMQIQHGQPKFTTQTLSRMGLIPQDVNVSKDVENVERIRNNALKILNSKLNNKNRSVENKKQLIEEFNNTMKGLRGQLKGTPAQGLVNFELFDIDKSGNVTKLKDTGFNPKKGLAYGDELGELDLSKITKEQADDIIALGKKKIDLDLLQKTTPGVTTADKIKRPESAKTRDMIKDFEIRTNQLGSNLGLIKGVGETIKAIPTPTGTLALTAGLGVDPASAIDRVALGAEAAFAPELVKQTSRLTSNPIVQRFFNLGLSPQMAMRAARVASPLGVASLAGEGLYQLGKRGAAEKAKLDAMTPFQKQQYLAGEIEPLMDEGGMVDISRDGFDEGGPSDPSKRKFMKILGGLATLPIVGKFFKAAEPVAEVAPQVVEGAKKIPPYFFKLIDKIKKFGKDETEIFASQPREKVTTYRTSDADYELYEDLGTGSTQIKIRKGDPDGGSGYKEQELTLTKGQSDESAGVVPDEYDEYTVRPDTDGKMKDIDEGLEDIDDLIEELGPENISVKELEDMGYDVNRLGPTIKKKLGIK